MADIVSKTEQLVSEATLQWLRDAPVASAEALAALSAVEPPPINPEPTPEDDDMDHPTTEAQLRDCLRGYAADNIVGMLSPKTHVELSDTIEIAQQTNSGYPWGVNGNFAKVIWRGGAGKDMLRFIGVDGVSNRGLTVEKLILDGGDPNIQGMGADACLRLSAPLGDAGPLYKFTLRDVFTMMAVNGIVIEGGVYEGIGENVHAENCSGDGILMRHLNLGSPGQGVVSNILLIHPNCSRCYGAGILAVYSVYIIGGSYILNGNGGVRAPDGLRGMIMSNGENTAGKEGAAFIIPNNGYGTVVNHCEGSSNGETVCRRWTGTAWEDVGAPMKYLMSIGSGVEQDDNHVSYYGGGSNPMQVVAPGGSTQGAPPPPKGQLHIPAQDKPEPPRSRRR